MRNIHITFKLILILLSSVIIGSLLMIGVYLLPVKNMIKNVKSSIDIFYEEETLEKVNNLCGGTLDNWTECMILGTAIYDGNKPLIDKAFSNYRYLTKIDPIHALKVQVLGKKYDITNYGRYWHGYLVYVKPLLMIFNYETIRILNTIGLILITIYLIYTMYCNNLKAYCIPYIISFILINPIISFYSIDFSNIIYIFTISCILIIKNKDIWKTNHYIYMFFIIGIIVAFTDFLTFPITTVGLPMIFYFILSKDTNIIANIKKMIIFSITWICGYLGMWSSKWIVGSIFTKENIIKNAINQIQMRTSNVSEMKGNKMTIFDILSRNFKEYFFSPFTLLVIAILLYYIFIIIKNNLWKNMIPYCIIFISISLMPIVWYVSAKGHSYDHYYFSFKLLMVTTFSLLSMSLKCINTSDMIPHIKNIQKNI